MCYNIAKKSGSEPLIPLKDRIPSEHPPFMTVIIILVNIAVFFYQNSLGNSEFQIFINHYATIPMNITHPAYGGTADFSALVSSQFLHGGWLHLIGNMWALWLFGDNVEDRMGPFKFLLFYLICGVIGNTAHVLVNPISTVPTIGASGAIAGIMGAYFILFPKARVLTLIPIIIYPWLVDIPAFIYLGFWFFMQLTSGMTGSEAQVAFWAHIGGFAAGVILHRLFMLHNPPPKEVV